MPSDPQRCARWRPTCLCLLAIFAGCAATRAADTGPQIEASARAVAELRSHLDQPAAARGAVADQPFAAVPLVRDDAERARSMLWADHAARLREAGAAEFNSKAVTAAGTTMRFDYRVFGDKPAEGSGGRAMFISMHGGGGAPPQVNDQQWRNQLRLYKPAEGVYVAPRAPTDSWNMWHRGHIDPLFDRLIALMVAFEDVDPDRVYLMGYSAGGDGVYQLAPRMADRWAAAAMMAGHPNDASPANLRNVPIALQVGEHDSPFNRNKIVLEWGKQLDDLRTADPAGYEHWVKLQPGKGHWMDLQDAAAVPWMLEHKRNPLPDRVVWRQTGFVDGRLYWLAVAEGADKPGSVITATRRAQHIAIESTGVDAVRVRLSDAMANLDEPVTITLNGRVAHEARVDRTIATLARTLTERGDERLMFSGEVSVGAATK